MHLLKIGSSGIKHLLPCDICKVSLHLPSRLSILPLCSLDVLQENANRSEALPPNQGGKYVGFGSTPPPRPGGGQPSGGDDISAYLTKGMSNLSVAAGMLAILLFFLTSIEASHFKQVAVFHLLEAHAVTNRNAFKRFPELTFMQVMTAFTFLRACLCPPRALYNFRVSTRTSWLLQGVSVSELSNSLIRL